VDFVVCQGLKPLCLIQVCERIDSEKVMKRETDPLLLAGEELKVNELILLADVIPDMKPPDGIKLISAIEWLTR